MWTFIVVVAVSAGAFGLLFGLRGWRARWLDDRPSRT